MHPALVTTTYWGFSNPHLIKCISPSKDLLTFVRNILEWGSQRKGFLILSTTFSLSLLTPNSHLIFLFIEWSPIFVSKRHNAMHYGIRAVIFRKSYQEILEIDFSTNFHVIHDFFWRRLSDHPKIWKRKKEFTNINLRRCKTKKNVKGWFFTDKTGLKIFVFINAMIFAFVAFVKNIPLWVKNAS